MKITKDVYLILFSEEYSEQICDCCKKYITGEFSGGNGWLCEGSFCEQAVEFYIDTIAGGRNYLMYCRKSKLKNIDEFINNYKK